MKIKRFFAKDMRAALAEIKETLGVDAIIMSNKKTADGVEIVAAVDEDNNAPLPKKAAEQATFQPGAPQAPAQPPVQSPVQPPAQPASRGGRDLDDDQISLSGFQQRLVQHLGNAAKHETPAAWQQPPAAPVQPQAQAEQPPEQAAENDELQALLQRQHEQFYQPPATPEADNGVNNPSLSKPLSPAGFPEGQAYKGFEPAPATTNSAELDELRSEMTSLRQLLEHQVSGLMSQDIERREPVRAMLLKQLQVEGFDQELATQFVNEIPVDVSLAQARQMLGGIIQRRLPSSDNDILAAGGVVALLGPTGVGKTTTVAKLAARYAMQFGADQVALVTTDSYRIGAHEQLNTYGKILGCPVKVAKDAQQLAEALHQLRNRRLILIDTAGMGQRDVRLSEQLATLMNSSHVNIRSYLVLSATAQRKVLQEAVVHFRKIPLSGCIFTKLDEALGIAEILSVAIQHGLPLGYLTDGQRVPEDIGIADVNALINRVLTDMSNHSNMGVGSDETMANQFASVNR